MANSLGIICDPAQRNVGQCVAEVQRTARDKGLILQGKQFDPTTGKVTAVVFLPGGNIPAAAITALQNTPGVASVGQYPLTVVQAFDALTPPALPTDWTKTELNGGIVQTTATNPKSAPNALRLSAPGTATGNSAARALMGHALFAALDAGLAYTSVKWSQRYLAPIPAVSQPQDYLFIHTGVAIEVIGLDRRSGSDKLFFHHYDGVSTTPKDSGAFPAADAYADMEYQIVWATGKRRLLVGGVERAVVVGSPIDPAVVAAAFELTFRAAGGFVADGTAEWNVDDVTVLHDTTSPI